jgi:hypothetical protein
MLYDLTQGLNNKSISDVDDFLAKQKTSIYDTGFDMFHLMDVYSLQMGLQSLPVEKKESLFFEFVIQVGALFFYIKDCFTVAVCNDFSEAITLLQVQLGNDPKPLENVRMLSKALIHYMPQQDVHVHYVFWLPFFLKFMQESRDLRHQNSINGVDVYTTTSDNIRLPDEYYTGLLHVMREYLFWKKQLIIL